jgi:hypothetical protein
MFSYLNLKAYMCIIVFIMHLDVYNCNCILIFVILFLFKYVYVHKVIYKHKYTYLCNHTCINYIVDISMSI